MGFFPHRVCAFEHLHPSRKDPPTGTKLMKSTYDGSVRIFFFSRQFRMSVSVLSHVSPRLPPLSVAPIHRSPSPCPHCSPFFFFEPCLHLTSFSPCFNHAPFAPHLFCINFRAPPILPSAICKRIRLLLYRRPPSVLGVQVRPSYSPLSFALLFPFLVGSLVFSGCALVFLSRSPFSFFPSPMRLNFFFFPTQTKQFSSVACRIRYHHSWPLVLSHRPFCLSFWLPLNGSSKPPP